MMLVDGNTIIKTTQDREKKRPKHFGFNDRLQNDSFVLMCELVVN